jgi:flagellum-specific peptidoglycan hydrolase FlgJ
MPDSSLAGNGASNTPQGNQIQARTMLAQAALKSAVGNTASNWRSLFSLANRRSEMRS